MSSSCRPEETYKPNRNAKEKEISTVENPVGVLIFFAWRNFFMFSSLIATSVSSYRKECLSTY